MRRRPRSHPPPKSCSSPNRVHRTMPVPMRRGYCPHPLHGPVTVQMEATISPVFSSEREQTRYPIYLPSSRSNARISLRRPVTASASKYFVPGVEGTGVGASQGRPQKCRGDIHSVGIPSYARSGRFRRCRCCDIQQTPYSGTYVTAGKKVNSLKTNSVPRIGE